jgi:hypothetical protein
MTSRERVQLAINHQQPDRVPLDLGSTGQTGISASTLYQLRRALGLETHPIYVHEPFQLLGEVEQDVRAALGVDVIGIWNPKTLFGTKNERWKPWQMPDNTPVLIGEPFEYDVDAQGNTLAYPQGDRSVPPSVKLPQGGFFFDNLDRGVVVNEHDLNARRDYQALYGVYSDEDARRFEREVTRWYTESEYALFLNFYGGSFGDVVIIPGPYETHPRGIRRIEDWYAAHALHPEYIQELFEMQAEIALQNLAILKQAVGDKVQIIGVSGTDFGSQNGVLISPRQFRKLYKPYFTRLNDWIHQNTSWKTFFHCCGSIVRLLDDFVEMGVDILNPVQCSAAGMDPVMLKEKYGAKLVFWGGGIDTQHVLPFGTPAEVRAQVRERLQLFAPGGGYVFNTIHNIVGKTPVENVLALFEELHAFNSR